jgi:hypothetical protein
MRSLIAALLLLFSSSVFAQPVAVVEDVQGEVIGAEFMDYVHPGMVIKLGPRGSLVLGYMKSCWRETITGVGTVIVGTGESEVHLGEVKAHKVQCDSSQGQLISRDLTGVAATVLRSVRRSSKSSFPQLTIYGLSPIVDVAGAGKLVVERLDVKGERYEVDLAAGSVVHGLFYDFAKTDTKLKPGGVYQASLGSRSMVFMVDGAAEANFTPIIGRLVHLN